MIANVPLLLHVFSRQAVTSDQTTAQLMAAIVTSAAGK